MARRLLLLASIVAGSLARPAPAGAVGRVLYQPGMSTRVEAVRVAQASSPSGATLWVAVRISGAGRFALVVPVPAGTAVDPALDAWLDALDLATAPRVRPPLGVPKCGATTSASIESTAWASEQPVAPTAVAVLLDVAEVQTYAGNAGLGFDAADSTALSSANPGSRFVAIVFEPTAASALTRTLRFTMPGESLVLPLALLGFGPELPEVTLFSIAEGRARVAGADELEKDQVSSTWNALDATSDYAEQRRGLLQSKGGGGWVLEATGSSPLFGWTVLPAGAGAISPGAKTYFEHAGQEVPGVGQPDACLVPLWDAQKSGELGARVSRACAPGLLATVPPEPGTAPCDETPGAGEVAAAALRCGSADDLAHALSGMRANAVRLTRQSGVIGSSTPAVSEIQIGLGADVSPLVTAAEADTTGCPGSGTGGAGGTSGFGGGWGYGGSDGLGATGGAVVGPAGSGTDTDVAVDLQCWITGDDGCSGDSSGAADDSATCSGDSSSGADEGDTCSGDSSGTADDSGDTCGGDSSGSSDEYGDTCGGDSSSSGDGASCSGDSGADAGGDACSGSSSGSGGGDCALPRGRRPRMRLSVLTLLLAGLALPLRRLRRKKGRRSP